jgi:hypothetical protein
MGDVFGVWVAQAHVWADGVHQVLLGIFAAFGATLVVWHAFRAVYGAITGNAARALKQACWQIGLVALGFEVVRNPEPIWRLAGVTADGFYRLLTAPFGG